MYRLSTLSVASGILFSLALLSTPSSADETPATKATHTQTVLISGASFASPNNTWFEMGCEALDAKPMNRAIGGESIADTANRMADGTLYSPKELEEIDAFVIMQVHDRDVFNSKALKESWQDYQTPFDTSDYAIAFDYVIKRYMEECYRLRENKDSKYYKTLSGKPAIIVLCTHWHDARVTYNTTIRQLAKKWGLPLVEFDKNIGFSKATLHPVTKQQHSRIFVVNDQEIDGVTYGWHPITGRDSYIQRKMAAIFADRMHRVLPLN